MSCTTDTKWPLPRWSAERLEQMKSELSNAANDPFAGFIAQVKLLATDGQISEAQSLLEQSQSWLKPATLDHGLFRNLLSAAFLAHASELAVAWLVRRFDASYGVSIDVSRSDGARDVVVLQVHGNDARFLFDRGLFDPPGHLVLIQRWADTYPLLDAFMASSHRVDGSVAINLGDGGHHPGLCFCDNRPSYFLIPDSLYMDSGRYNSIRAKFREQNVPWHNRVPVAFWRGATTGRPSRPGIGWRGLPRIQLSLFTHDHPDLIDARITNVVQIADPAAREWLQSSDLLRSHVPFHAFQKFRYQIDIDGNTNSWPGLFMKLLSGSPVVKIASSTGH